MEESSENRLIELEAKLLEQEHRPFHLVFNFLNRKKWNENDVRRKAVSKAIIIRLLFSPASVLIFSGGFLGFLSIFFLYQQNQLLRNQNYRIEQQTYLIEAERRSSMVFVMSQVMQEFYEEIENNNAERKISSSLSGRIFALSQAMKPYRYMEGNELINNPLSPERGQLLTVLVESEIDSIQLHKLLEKCDFSYAEIGAIDLSDLNLNYSNFAKAEFNSTVLEDVNFKNGFLVGAIFNRSYLNQTNFNNAHMSSSLFFSSELDGTSFHNSDLRNSRFINWPSADGAQFILTNLQNATFENCYLNGTIFMSPILQNVEFKNVELDGAIVDRPDWLEHIRDSWKVKGIDNMINKYRTEKIENLNDIKYFHDFAHLQSFGMFDLYKLKKIKN